MTITNPVDKPSPGNVFAVLVGLAALGIASLALLIDRMGPTGDWWYVVAQFEDGLLPSAFQWDLTRPLVGVVWRAMWQIFGYHLLGWYIILFSTMTLSVMILWHLLWHYFNLPWTIAALVAAFVLIYPSDTARVYIAALTNRQAILVCLLGTWAWLAAGSTDNPQTVVLRSLLCIVLLTTGLLLYEGPLGVLLILPVLVLVMQANSLRIWHLLLKRLRWLLVWYIGPLLFAIYRLVLEPSIQEIIKPQLIELNFSPTRILQQLSYFPSTTLWGGWFYSLIAITHIKSVVAVLVAIVLIVVVCFLLHRQIVTKPARFYRSVLLAGVVLLAASAFPIVISTLDVSTMVGTLMSRTLSSAALGHALIIVAVIGWLSTFSRALGAVLSTTLLSLAVAGSVGLQTIYTEVWTNQLRVVEALETYAPRLPEGTTLVLLDLPSNAYETRYAYPYTRLVRVLYGDRTLQVAPWLANYSPDQQLFAFGQNSLVIVETLDHLETINRPYEGAFALRYHPDGPMTPVQTIDQPYLLSADKAWFVAPQTVGRQKPFELAPLSGQGARPDNPILIEYCQRLLGSCNRTGS